MSEQITRARERSLPESTETDRGWKMSAASSQQSESPAPAPAAGRRAGGGASRPQHGELERLWLSGDPSALAHTHRRYRGRLEAVAFRIVKNHADAEDVVQKIFISLRGSAFRGDSSLWTYLYRAAVNGSVNLLRSRRRRETGEQRLIEAQALSIDAQPRPTEAYVLESQIMAQVSQALLGVKPQHRRVLTLRIIHGLSNTEIAELEDLPLPTVGTWLRRGRGELQRGLKSLLKEIRKTRP